MKYTQHTILYNSTQSAINFQQVNGNGNFEENEIWFIVIVKSSQ